MTESIQIVSPPSDRPESWPKPKAKPTKEDFEKMGQMTMQMLGDDWGLGYWDGKDDLDANGAGLMLFPHEWYDCIPEGFMVECIGGETEPFKKGVTDDDRRFGMLAYGVRAVWGHYSPLRLHDGEGG